MRYNLNAEMVASLLGALVSDDDAVDRTYDDLGWPADPDDDVVRPVAATAYESAGVLTRDDGFVLTMDDGAEFQVTVVRSRPGRDAVE